MEELGEGEYFRHPAVRGVTLTTLDCRVVSGLRPRHRAVRGVTLTTLDCRVVSGLRP